MEAPLTLEDFQTRTWALLASHMRERIAELREENDSFKLDEAATARTRGRIAQLKELLALADKAAEARASRGSAGDSSPQPSSPLGNF